MNRTLLISAAVLLAVAVFDCRTMRADNQLSEDVQTPPPAVVGQEELLSPQMPSDVGGYSPTDSSSNAVHVFPAVIAVRRYGPVEESEPEFYTLRNAHEPGFDWSAGLAAGAGLGYGGWGYGSAYPGYGFGLVGYNRYSYRPWYTSPAPYVWGTKFPWYSPGGLGPNIYQPWYLWPNRLPWYTPYGIGPNIYQPWYTGRSYSPWYSPYGSGPNIYTPAWQYGGCLYW